ncbi:MAG: EAL domain-containing protein [Oceanospirillaceae bacterium]|nr:EAL domain-containing protein [Oceanospirillaceae bacterium]
MLCAVAFGLWLAAQQSLMRLDLRLYDLLLPLQSPAMSDRIAVVTIDDASIDALGRWPWPRQRHAELVDRLTAMRVKAVGLDVLFSEAQDAAADSRLAEAIRRNGRTVLPVAPVRNGPQTPIRELLPLPELAAAAAALGHVDVELDIDGYSRQFYFYGGLGDARWPGLPLAMLQVAGEPARLPDIEAEPGAGASGWTRRMRTLIPFAAADDPPLRLSYADLLNGRVTPDELVDKYVLVGVAAAGIGDLISTPVSLDHGRTPGVELIAQVLNGLLQRRMLRFAPESVRLPLTGGLIAIGTLVIVLLPLRFGLLAVAGGMLVTVSGAALLLRQGLWFAPAAVLVMLALAWLLWSLWCFGIEERLTRHLLKRLDHQTRHHPVSGLPNQGMLEERLRHLGDPLPDMAPVGLLVLNLSWQESASGLLHRHTGDALLRRIVERLREALPANSFVSHLNSDDFGILLPDGSDGRNLQPLVDGMLNQLRQPLAQERRELLMVPSVGISVWPDDARDGPGLLRNAYTALFQARLAGGDDSCFYSADIGQRLQVRAELEQAIIHALEREEFRVFYQAQVDAVSHRIIGAEALLRWHNPRLGWISPSEFIPVAEHSGLIDRIGNWVLNMVCLELKHLECEGLGPLRLAVNLSPLQFTSPRLVLEIQEALRKSGMPPASLELEVTESCMMSNLGDAVRAMNNLHELGFELAVDDFGTGYSSLSALSAFPVDRLKIDQSFTREIGSSDSADNIVLSILSMARSLGLGTIAEGVETPEQAAFLARHGCDELQGYLFSRPLPADEFMALVRQGGRPGA